MDKETEDKFIQLLSKVQDEKLKAEFLKCFFEVSSKLDDLILQQATKKGCVPCVSNCSNNNICNDNETDLNTK